MDINKIENILKEYEKIKKKKRILELELECIEETGVSAIDYSSDKVSATHKISRPTENCAIKNIKNISKNSEIRKEIKRNIKILDSRIRIIDCSLELLTKEQKGVIYKYYIEDKTYDMIGREMYLSSKQIRERRKAALDKLKSNLVGTQKGHLKVTQM